MRSEILRNGSSPLYGALKVMKEIHSIVFIVITVLLTIAGDVQGFFETDPPFGIETPWSYKTFTRKMDHLCECGQHQHISNGSQPWNVFLHIQADPSLSPTICVGTIITSNLIATSHVCFLYPSRHLNIYDLWRPQEGERNAVWEASQVIVSTTLDPSLTECHFEVEDIIYHPEYVMISSNSAIVFPPRFDLALVKIKAFNVTHSLHPICIPSYEHALELWDEKELENAEAYYYGYDEEAVGNKLGEHHGVLKTEEHGECIGSFEMKYDFCFQYASQSGTTPTSTGGPLYVISAGTYTSFLIGIASSVKPYSSSQSPTGIDNDYFTNLFPLIKYIEFMAKKHKSSWCIPPKQLTLTRKHEDEAPARDAYLRELEGNSGERNENLDCVCGIANNEVGGKTVHPHQLSFPWVSFIRLHVLWRARCVGTVINDRMVLSAAHCVLFEETGGDVHPRVLTPHDVDVLVEVRNSNGEIEYVVKNVSTILFHPEFAYARKKNYYDYDVAIFILTEPLAFDSNSEKGFRPVCLPKKDQHTNLIGVKGIVAGWGLADPTEKSNEADELQVLEVPIIDRKQCSDVATSKVTERNICAGGINRYNEVIGYGDSGGPLMMRINDQFMQVGIVSWREDVSINGVMNIAALYSDVQRLVSFIDYHANKVHANWCKPTPAAETQTASSPTT